MTLFHTVAKVVFRDLDPFGHVNNAVYFTYMEIARTEYYLHLTRAKTLDEVSFIIARASCDFRHPAKFGDELHTFVWPSEIGNSSFKLRYEIRRKQDDALIAEGETVQVAYDYSKRRKMPLPETVKKALTREKLAHRST